jgi:5-methylcytosine-specific restriction protein B
MSWTSYQQEQDPDLPEEIDSVAAPAAGPPADFPDALDFASLAAELLLPVDFLERVDWLFEDRSAVIFSGPPGSGKTYLARALAKFYSEERYLFLQFHPSYSYEDFVEGFRPQRSTTGGLNYEIVPGPLRIVASQATQAELKSQADGTEPARYALVVDEINRANLSKVLGELFFALEYRNHPVMLQYSRQRLVLPKNLLIIGTMNTADRSIATFDSALRRRFHFVDCNPTQPPFENLLSRYLEAHGRSHMFWLSDLLKLANSELPDPAYAVGPSYFMRPNIDRGSAALIWRHSVWPYLTSRFDPESIPNLRWEALYAAIASESATADPAPTSVTEAVEESTQDNDE